MHYRKRSERKATFNKRTCMEWNGIAIKTSSDRYFYNKIRKFLLPELKILLGVEDI